MWILNQHPVVSRSNACKVMLILPEKKIGYEVGTVIKKGSVIICSASCHFKSVLTISSAEHKRSFVECL